MGKIAKIKNGGVFKKGTVIVTNIKKDGTEGESKVYTISGKVKVKEMDGKIVLHFNVVTGGSMRVSSRGTVSGGSHVSQKDIVVDSYEYMEE